MGRPVAGSAGSVCSWRLPAPQGHPEFRNRSHALGLLVGLFVAALGSALVPVLPAPGGRETRIDQVYRHSVHARRHLHRMDPGISAARPRNARRADSRSLTRGGQARMKHIAAVGGRNEMPLYDYECKSCGPFRDWRPMSEWTAGAPCPDCSAPAPRQTAAPMLAALSSNNRIAHERNERSAHEPRVVRREHLPQGHSDSHPHDVNPLIKQQFGNVSQGPPGWPWMVGH